MVRRASLVGLRKFFSCPMSEIQALSKEERGQLTPMLGAWVDANPTHDDAQGIEVKDCAE